jgi:hypothetical protein
VIVCSVGAGLAGFGGFVFWCLSALDDGRKQRERLLRRSRALDY